MLVHRRDAGNALKEVHLIKGCRIHIAKGLRIGIVKCFVKVFSLDIYFESNGSVLSVGAFAPVSAGNKIYRVELTKSGIRV